MVEPIYFTDNFEIEGYKFIVIVRDWGRCGKYLEVILDYCQGSCPHPTRLYDSSSFKKYNIDNASSEGSLREIAGTFIVYSTESIRSRNIKVDRGQFEVFLTDKLVTGMNSYKELTENKASIREDIKKKYEELKSKEEKTED